MKQAVTQAIESFCSTILYAPLQQGKTKGKQFYGAAISLHENDEEHIWYLFFKRHTLNEIAKNLLFEEHLCEDDLDDLLKEVSNQIIGSAKVILEAANPNIRYQLSVPEFMGTISAPFPMKLQEIFLYKIKNRTFLVGRAAI